MLHLIRDVVLHGTLKIFVCLTFMPKQHLVV